MTAVKWDASTETLQPEALDDVSMARYRSGLVAMDKFLGAYQYDVQLKKWISLSDHISPNIIAALVLYCIAFALINTTDSSPSVALYRL